MKLVMKVLAIMAWNVSVHKPRMVTFQNNRRPKKWKSNGQLTLKITLVICFSKHLLLWVSKILLISLIGIELCFVLDIICEYIGNKYLVSLVCHFHRTEFLRYCTQLHLAYQTLGKLKSFLLYTIYHRFVFILWKNYDIQSSGLAAGDRRQPHWVPRWGAKNRSQKFLFEDCLVLWYSWCIYNWYIVENWPEQLNSSFWKLPKTLRSKKGHHLLHLFHVVLLYRASMFMLLAWLREIGHDLFSLVGISHKLRAPLVSVCPRVPGTLAMPLVQVCDSIIEF